MQVVWKLFAAFALLLSVSTTAFRVDTDQIAVNDPSKELTPFAVFDAIFKWHNPHPNNTLQHDINVIVDIFGCERVLLAVNHHILVHAGHAMGRCVFPNRRQLELALARRQDLAQIREHFKLTLEMCLREIGDLSKCYVETISITLRVIKSNNSQLHKSKPIIPCLEYEFKKMLKELEAALEMRNECVHDVLHGNSTWAPPHWNSTQTPPHWNSTGTPPSWNTTQSPPHWNSTGTPPSWNSTQTPPHWNSTGTPPSWNTTQSPPQWNSTWAPPQGNTTQSPPQWNSTWAPPQGNTTLSPPQWNSTWVPPQGNTTQSPPQWNSTWAPPQGNTTRWPPQWNSTWAPPQGNTTATTPQKTTNWWDKVWSDIEHIF